MPKRFDMRRRPPCPPSGVGPPGKEIRPDVPTPAPVEEEPKRVPPSRDEVINLLLQSIALEEAALAALINTEAERVQLLSGTFAEPVTFDEVLSLQRSVADVLQAVVRKEEVLLRKLTTVLRIPGVEER